MVVNWTMRTLALLRLCWACSHFPLPVRKGRGESLPLNLWPAYLQPLSSANEKEGIWPISLGCHMVSLSSQWLLGLEWFWTFESDIAISNKLRLLLAKGKNLHVNGQQVLAHLRNWPGCSALCASFVNEFGRRSCIPRLREQKGPVFSCVMNCWEIIQNVTLKASSQSSIPWAVN